MEISLKRIWLLCKKQWVDHQKMYLLGLLAIAGIMAAVFLISTTAFFFGEGLTVEAQNISFLFGLIGFGVVFTSTLLSQLSEKSTGIQMLLLPASSLEKTLVVILFSNLLFPLAYTLVVYPVILLVHYLDVNVKGNLNGLIEFRGYFFMILCILFLLGQNLMLLCSLIFRRYAFIKMAILACFLTFGFFYLNSQFAATLVNNSKPEGKVNMPAAVYEAISSSPNYLHDESSIQYRLLGAAPFINMKFLISENSIALVELPQSQAIALNIVFYGCMMILLWLATWFRLREKQL